jgi:hypothetical protein
LRLRRLKSYYAWRKAEEAKANAKTPIKPAIKEAPVTPRRLGLADLRAPRPRVSKRQ